MTHASIRAEQEANPSRPIRTLFVSDVHLGCRHANAAAFLDLLDAFQPRRLYIVGDFIDGWKLRRRWHWDPANTRILRRLMQFALGGGSVRYTPGNHDAFAREFPMTLGSVEVADEFVHHTADGRRFLVTHGDRFDRVETGARWMSLAATIAYDALLATNAWFHRMFGGKRSRPYAFSAAVKRSVKGIVQYVSDFETELARHARSRGCDGVVCGHIHTPTISSSIGSLTYCNTGDWVEHCTALIEHESGRLDLIERTPQGAWSTLASSAPRIPPSLPTAPWAGALAAQGRCRKEYSELNLNTGSCREGRVRETHPARNVEVDRANGVSRTQETWWVSQTRPTLHSEPSDATRRVAPLLNPEARRWRGSTSAWPAKDGGTRRASGPSPNDCAWSTS